MSLKLPFSISPGDIITDQTSDELDNWWLILKVEYGHSYTEYMNVYAVNISGNRYHNFMWTSETNFPRVKFVHHSKPANNPQKGT